MPGTLHVVGVRHHSPACARLVAKSIEAIRPRYVLIEGPADMNGRLNELAMQRELPFAVYSYLSGPNGTHGSWSPFCDYSPEWIAIKAAEQIGAEARFIDLPSWSKAFIDVRNRYADRRLDAVMEALCERFGTDGTDALWDHLFEQPEDAVVLAERLHTYFVEIRDAESVSPRDEQREAFMAKCIAWAVSECADDEHVLVVCGGYHAPFLESAWEDAEPVWPEFAVPADPEGLLRWGSYVVPYTFRRLDSFTGYQAGMPSPGWYQAVWEQGPEVAPERMLELAVKRLRARKQVVSAADMIAALSLSCGLQQIRGHSVIARVDLLDGLAGALIKEALDQPVPWSRRGVLSQGTAPALVEVVAAFSGDKEGVLAEGTPQPPLVHDVQRLLKAHKLTPTRKVKSVKLKLDVEAEREKSRILHRLRVLGIPGFTRQQGPAHAVDGQLQEQWTYKKLLEADAALIEAGAYGATLASAATARLEEQLLAIRDQFDALVKVLIDGVFTGIDQLADRVLREAALAAGAEPRLEVVGEALSLLLSLWRHDALMGAAGADALAMVIRTAFERGLWLYESIDGPSSAADRGWIAAAVSLRNTQRFAGAALGLDPDVTFGVMRRRSNSQDAPPALRGAGLGCLWSLGGFVDPAEAEARATEALNASGRPEELGDFLAGLFGLAREEVLFSEGLVEVIDARVCELEPDNYLEALPSLRLAFAYFPPREKERIAKRLFGLHGGDTEDVRSTLKLKVSAQTITEGLALDRRVDDAVARYGLE